LGLEASSLGVDRILWNFWYICLILPKFGKERSVSIFVRHLSVTIYSLGEKINNIAVLGVANIVGTKSIAGKKSSINSLIFNTMKKTSEKYIISQ
jgi:hypothetical protein